MKKTAFAISLVVTSLLSLGQFAQARAASGGVCAGDRKCDERKVRDYITQQLADKNSQLYKQFVVANGSDHYECYGEDQDPIGEATRKPDIELLQGGGQDENDNSESENSPTIYSSQVIASIALPSDCNEGSIIHNWYPRLMVLFRVNEQVKPTNSSSFTSSTKIKMVKVL